MYSFSDFEIVTQNSPSSNITSSPSKSHSVIAAVVGSITGIILVLVIVVISVLIIRFMACKNRHRLVIIDTDGLPNTPYIQARDDIPTGSVRVNKNPAYAMRQRSNENSVEVSISSSNREISRHQQSSLVDNMIYESGELFRSNEEVQNTITGETSSPVMYVNENTGFLENNGEEMYESLDELDQLNMSITSNTTSNRSTLTYDYVPPEL